jgi:dCTP deaminase
MGEAADRVSLESVPVVRVAGAYATGLLPSQAIRALVEAGEIRAVRPIASEQIQPASIDLRLGAVAYRVRASFLPGRQQTVRERIDQFGMHAIDLSKGAVLEKGCVYIVPLSESLNLSQGISGIGNPKSSTGRLDVFTRLITDRAAAFDRVESGYAGPLYAEISPRAFSIVVREGSRLSQLRLRRGSPTYTDDQLWKLHEQFRLVDRAIDQKDIAAGIPFTVDLKGTGGSRLVGYKARPHAALIDVDKVNHYDPEAYWEPVHARDGRGMILNPGDFYILASAEAVTIPPAYAAEMVPYDTSVGEFRVHYAGFFDPGFGYSPSGGHGSRAVLEVRAHEVPFLVEHGQIVGRLLYERLTDIPDKLYGQTIGSSYQQQGLRLSKQFKQG